MSRRVALVGAGWIADSHAEILAGLAGVEIAVVCDPDRARAEALARRFGIARVVSSIDEIAAGEVDVAHVLVQPPLHEPLARALLEREIGVFVEKPLALSAAGARSLAELAAARGVPLGVNHNFVCHPAFARLLARVAAGAIGRVEHVRVELAAPLAQLEAGAFGHWMFLEPRNIVYEQGVHPLALVHALLGRVESAATTILESRELAAGQTFHARWAVAARAERGTAEIQLAFGAAFERFVVQVRGSDGFLEADLRRDTLVQEGKSRWLEFFDTYLASARRGAMLRRDARRGLAGYMLSTLRLARREDGFFASMRGSIEAFHRALAGNAQAAVEVLGWCDEVARVAAPARGPAVAREPGPARAGEVVVLGANGFIGRRVVAKLLERGLPVTVVVRGAPFPAPEDVRVFRARLEDPASLERAIAGAKIVLHLATGSIDTWEAIERTMVRGSIAAADAALRAKVERFVFVSSIAALDTSGSVPIEDSLATDPRPESRSVYARGKIATEKALVELHRSKGLPLVIVRPGIVLGAGSPFQHSGFGLWVRDNQCVGWGAGDHPLPLVWVDDVAEALAAIAAFPGRELDGRALDLAANVPLTARDAVAALRAATGRDLHFSPRPLAVSYAMELGKWLVKKVGRRDAGFPSWHDFAARALSAPIPSRTAREVLRWRPLEEREAFLERALRAR